MYPGGFSYPFTGMGAQILVPKKENSGTQKRKYINQKILSIANNSKG